MAESIEHLRVYTSARELEDRVYELVKGLDPKMAYPFGNNLRRASAATCHYLTETHRCFSYSLKLENMAQARLAAEATQLLLSELSSDPMAQQIRRDYTGVVKQIWGFMRYLKGKRREKMARIEIRGRDELVAARA